MTIDTKRLATDAAYWDEVERDFGCVSPGTPPTICGIPRPTTPAAPEWDGESMISVGEWAEGLLEVADGCREWQRCRCIGFLNGMVVVCSEDETMVDLLNHTRGDVRPLRTKEQRQKDELEYLMRGDSEFFIPDWIRLKVADAILSRYNLEPKP